MAGVRCYHIDIAASSLPVLAGGKISWYKISCLLGNDRAEPKTRAQVWVFFYPRAEVNDARTRSLARWLNVR